MFTALLALIPSAFAVPVVILDNPNNQLIYSGRDNLCLSLNGGASASPYAGAPVVSWPCDTASTWNINRGQGKIQLAKNTGFAFDIGLNPANNGPLKIWTSLAGASQQEWYFTDDNRIAHAGGTQCLDEGDNGVQTYQCTTGNRNQIFYTTSPSPGNNPTPETSISHPSGSVTIFKVAETEAATPAAATLAVATPA